MKGFNSTIFIIILTAATFGLTYGLSAPLIALELSDEGYSETVIGANSAMHALGVLLIAPFLAKLSWRLGFGKLAKTALLFAGVIFAVFPVMPFVWVWFPLRAALGAASETLLVVSETWINHVTKAEHRGSTIAIYVAALSTGMALGPAILVLVGREQSMAFFVGAGLALFACIILLLGQPRETRPERKKSVNPIRYIKLAPVAVAAAALNAALETAGLSLLPIYAINLGWPEQSATILLTVLLVGSIVLQLPIGWISDRMNRYTLVFILATISAIGALIWPNALAHPWLAYPLLFIWGGTFVGIYTTMIAILGDQFPSDELMNVYALLSIAWGIGALAGPLLGGVAMETYTHGLPLFAASCCSVFALFTAINRVKRNLA